MRVSGLMIRHTVMENTNI
jgi:hypothetical protein